MSLDGEIVGTLRLKIYLDKEESGHE
jgi:hypothetical protein